MEPTCNSTFILLLVLILIVMEDTHGVAHVNQNGNGDKS